MTVVGNVYDKYNTRNPIARALMNGFLRAAGELYLEAAAPRVLEVGCGEGLLARHLYGLRAPSEGFEITDVEIGQVMTGLPAAITVRQASTYALPYADKSFDLIVCCEVLEHVDEPHRALRELRRVARSRVLVSTPLEPFWRVLNVARGKYWTALGNTPGHIQHFSRAGLLDLCRSELRLERIRTPLPWTMVLGEPLR